MCDIVEISDDEESSVPSNVLPITLKEESLNYNFPPHNTCSRPAVENVASSSGTNLRSSFIGMGFAPSLVDKAIEEHGEGNADLLLEALFAYPDHDQPKTEESLDDGLSSSSSDNLTARHHVKEEPDAGSISDGKKASLLKMNFSLAEVDFAMDRLGKHATVGQLMDFVFAARMAKKYEKEGNNLFPRVNESEEDCSTEALFGIMEKTLQLLEMGFTENEISAAFEKCGSEAPLPDLANSVVDPAYQYRPLKRKSVEQSFDSIFVKTEDSIDVASEVGTSNSHENLKAKMPEAQEADEPNKFKKPKEEFTEDTGGSVGRTWLKARKGNSTSPSSRVTAWERQIDHPGGLEEDEKPTMSSIPGPSRRTLTGMVAKPPYFLYGNVTNLSHSSWVKVTQFLYSIQPEIVNTEMYSALSRTEGYVHNLPMEDRFHISPKGPMTIEEAIPHAKKWWPPWDNRKQLNSINCEISGVSHFCDMVRRILTESDAVPPLEQQRDLIQQFQAKNLVWVGHNRLGPLEPEQIERIMGYPLHHSRIAGFGVPERLKSLKLSFQTDTLGYHLSVLRKLYPRGMTVFSFFSGIGGAEVALHRLGIHLKAVVSVETSEIKRKILKKWWENSGQSGELIQIDSILKLSSNKLEELIKKAHGFDLIICQNPYSGDDSDMLSGLDFSLFVEFVRVLQRVRSRR